MSLALPLSPAPAYALSLLLSAAVVLLALVPLGAARSQANFQIEDLRAPRAMFDRLPAWGTRATWAQQNGFEALTLYAPACLLMVVAVLHGPETNPSAPMAAALLHPLFRLIYLVAYVADLPPVRSLCWAAGLFCTLILYLAGFSLLLHS